MSDTDEEEIPMSRGGMGFSLGRRKLDDYGEGSGGSSYKKRKTNNNATASAANPNSFAARMMAKMGYKEGEGLGATGRGRLAPIETQLRPQGVGLGAVKEKTKQAKEEEKREAAFRGEVFEDSSEEERKRRKKQKEKRMANGGSGASTPGALRARLKPKYRTTAEIEAEAEGLQVPNVLKSIIDITGKETKLLSSGSGVSTPNEYMVPSETEATKIARRARRDLEAFADEWSNLTDRKKYFELQSSHLIGEIDAEFENIRRLEGVIGVVEQLQQISIENNEIDEGMEAWEKITSKLETMEIGFRDDLDKYGMQEVAVAAIHPLFRKAMLDWDPLSDPTLIVTYIERLQHVLGIESVTSGNAVVLQNGHQSINRSRKSTTHYETLIYTLWLPPVRTAITNTWDVHNPDPLIALITAWRPLLPAFVLSNLINQLLIPRLTSAITDWKPRKSKKSHQTPPPHIWLFPWLQHLPAHHTDFTASSGLLVDIKRKFRSLLTTHDLSTGIPSYLTPWQPVLRSNLSDLLVRHLLPRLATHLQTHFTVDPQDQDLTPFTAVLAWTPLFSSTTMAQLLLAEFFPLFHSILHTWLISEPNYDEISQWFAWWQEQIPPSLNALPMIAAEWTKGFETINLALELGDRVATHLPPPAAGPTRPLPSTPLKGAVGANGAKSATPKPPPQPETTFKDIVEDWAVEQGLWMMPLREAHETTGLPLFRLTASSSGKGGAVFFVKGDLLVVRDKKDKGVWKPVGLGAGLVEMAGG